MKSKIIFAKILCRIFGVATLVFVTGSTVGANADIQCNVDRETMCRWEQGFPEGLKPGGNPAQGTLSPWEQYAQMHGGCGNGGDQMGPGCMRGRRHGHHGMSGGHGRHGMMGGGPTGETTGGTCPQERHTAQAPEPWQTLKNPVANTPDRIEQGRLLFQVEAQPNCTACHGVQGNGAGPMGMGLVPPPRNFTCAETMNTISDGQLFWIIKNGSDGTAMPAFGQLDDESVWQIILYLRQLGSN